MSNKNTSRVAREEGRETGASKPCTNTRLISKQDFNVLCKLLVFCLEGQEMCFFYGFTMQCFFFYFSMYVFPCITFLKFVYDTFLPIPYHTKLVFEHSTICQYSTFIRVLYILCIHLQHSHLQSCSRVQDLGYTPAQYSYTILS